MPLYMDVHTIDGGVAVDDVAKAHMADLQTQGKYDVRYLRYWVERAARQGLLPGRGPVRRRRRRPSTARRTASSPTRSSRSRKDPDMAPTQLQWSRSARARGGRCSARARRRSPVLGTGSTPSRRPARRQQPQPAALRSHHDVPQHRDGRAARLRPVHRHGRHRLHRHARHGWHGRALRQRHAAWADPSIDARQARGAGLRPRSRTARCKLAAVEYVVVKADWDAHHKNAAARCSGTVQLHPGRQPLRPAGVLLAARLGLEAQPGRRCSRCGTRRCTARPDRAPRPVTSGAGARGGWRSGSSTRLEPARRSRAAPRTAPARSRSGSATRPARTPARASLAATELEQQVAAHAGQQVVAARAPARRRAASTSAERRPPGRRPSTPRRRGSARRPATGVSSASTSYSATIRGPVGVLRRGTRGRGRRRSPPAARTAPSAAERLARGPAPPGRGVMSSRSHRRAVLVEQQHRLAVRARPARAAATTGSPSARPARAPRARPAPARPARGRAAAPRRTARAASSRRRRSPSSPR